MRITAHTQDVIDEILSDVKEVQDKIMSEYVADLKDLLGIEGGTSSVGEYPHKQSGDLQLGIDQKTVIIRTAVSSTLISNAPYSIYLDRTQGGWLKRKLLGDFAEEEIAPNIVDKITNEL